MPERAFARQEENVQGYSSNDEYLADEFKRLDLLIQLKLEYLNTDKLGLFDQLKGLVISDDEITEIFSEKPVSPKSGPLYNELLALEKEIAFKEANTHRFLGLPAISRIFHLTPFEKNCLLVCLASEIDPKYEKLYAYLQDDVTKKIPTIGLIDRLLGNSFSERLHIHAIFHPSAPLLKFKLLSFVSQHEIPFPSKALKLDDQIKNFMIGVRFLDARIAGISWITTPGTVDEGVIALDEQHDQMRRAAMQHFSNKETVDKNLIMFFYGPKGGGKKTFAKAICDDLGLPLIVADLEKITEEESLRETVWLLSREAVLHSSALCLDGIDRFSGLNTQHLEALLHSIQAFSKLTFLLAKSSTLPRGALADHVFVDLKFTIPDETMRKHLWKWYLEKYCDAGDSQDIEALAGKFRFTPGQIRDAASAAGNMAHCFSSGNSFYENLHDVCRNMSHSNLSRLAGKTDAKRTWDDIILAPNQLAHMKEICDQAKFRKVVYGDWGYGKKLSIGKGLAILFSGPPGSGKTLAAEIIAGELQLHLYKIDLSRVVDKYIGETEKNLNRIFSEAERSNAVLFFDEADALFGKRSETKDSHDRYANIEVGYLLQRIEEYEGIVILATNLVNNMDEAFQRRMNFIIQFPFPDVKDRERIWKHIYPQNAPLSNDVDFMFLAEKLKICGGNIKNISLASAFFAAREKTSIGMKEIMMAARREYQKMGKPLVPGDFVPYADLLGDI